MLAKLPLRWRLLAIGVLCAILTGLSGGAAIVSLHEIHRNMRESTKSLLAVLPEDELTRSIGASLTDLSTVLDRGFSAKTEILGRDRELASAFAGINERMEQIETAMAERSRNTRREAEESLSASADLVNQWQRIELLLVGISFVLAIWFAVAVSRSVLSQLQAMGAGIAVVAEGNLDQRIGTGTNDEVGRLSRAFDDMAEKLAIRDRSVRDNEECFRNLFEQSNDGILILDREHEILDANIRMARMMGCERADMLGRSALELVDPADRERLREALVAAADGESSAIESVLINGADTAVDIEFRASIVDPTSGVSQGVVRDITDRKRAEESLRQNLEQISEGKRRLELLVSNTAERERRMVLLKEEVNDLLAAAGQPARYQAPRKVSEAGLAAALAHCRSVEDPTCP